MDNKKNINETKNPTKIGYFAGVRHEWMKIAWPNREKVTKSLAATVGVCTTCGVFFYLISIGILAITKIVSEGILNRHRCRLRLYHGKCLTSHHNRKDYLE